MDDRPEAPGSEDQQANVPILEEEPGGTEAAGAPPPEEPLTTGFIQTTGGGWRAIALPVLAVVAALVIGGLVIIFSDQEALGEWKSFFRNPGDALSVSWRVVSEAYYALFSGALGSPSQLVRAFGSGEIDQIRAALFPLSETIIAATPLIFVGLSVALGFQAGLFNIGAEGQMNVGAMAAAAAGIAWAGLPGPILLVLMILAGFAGGALWGAIPGFLKAKTGAHEVITTIMLNFVAVSLTLYVLKFAPYKQQAEPIAKPVAAAFPRLFGGDLRVNLGFFLALGVAWLVAWLLNRTTVGFEFQAVGANPSAARAAGMSPTRTIVVVMTLAGGLSGLAAVAQLGGATPSLIPGFASGLGFTAIALALVGRGTPLGVVLAALIFGILQAGGRAMQAVTQTPIDIIVVIQALVIMFIAAPALVRALFRIKARRVTGPQAFTKGWG